MKKIYKPENGIYGYAPAAPDGARGKDGNDIFYSPINLDKNINISITKSLITNNHVLSLIQSIQYSERVNYSDGDLILTKDGSVYIMNDIEDDIRIDRVGSIKIPIINQYEGNSPLSGYTIIFAIIHNLYTSENIYNYIEGCESPLYHHRDSIDASTYGNYIVCTASLEKVIPVLDGKYIKLVINFISGMRFEKILTEKDYADPIFIDNRYILNYGHTENEVYSTNTGFSNYDEEKSVSFELQTNLSEKGKFCMADGYIEYSYQEKTYRQKIIISNA